MTRMDHPIDEVNAAALESLDSAPFSSGQPFVARNLLNHWPAVQSASDDKGIVGYLLRFDHGQNFKVVVAPPASGGRIFYNSQVTGFNFDRQLGRLAPVLERMLDGKNVPNGQTVVIQSAYIDEYLPGFIEDNPLGLMPAEVRPRIWISNRSRVAAHYDPQDNLACCVAGRRRFTLFPPRAIAHLYIGPIDRTPAGAAISMVDLENPDLEKYPEFPRALELARHADLGPGDALFIPAFWWHAVSSLEPVNVLVNYWWSRPRELDGIGDSAFDALLHALLSVRDLPADQREAWSSFFDHYVFLRNGDPAAHLPPGAHGTLGRLSASQRAHIRQHLVKKLGPVKD